MPTGRWGYKESSGKWWYRYHTFHHSAAHTSSEKVENSSSSSSSEKSGSSSSNENSESGDGKLKEIYSIGFESNEGYVAATDYQNTTVKLHGPENYQWGVLMGTPTTTDKISGDQSIQMRYYASTKPNNYGSLTSQFMKVSRTVKRLLYGIMILQKQIKFILI